MTAALSGEQRSELEKLVQNTRRWIETDLEERLEGKFGIYADGRIDQPDRLALTNAEDAVRADLVEIVEYLRSEGEGEAPSVERLVREAAFTHTNRLIAVRVAESVGLLPETVGRGVASRGFKDFSELAPTVAATEWGRFAVLVALCADELAVDIPALFDPRNPLLELAMSETVLARAVEAMSAVDHEVWEAPDTLGWAYQFFNTGEERRQMRESSAPRNSRELAVRNQFFTPSYVVEFLVQNGLGERLASGIPDLASELPLLIEVPAEEAEIDLEQVSVLDPACGSGHFLLGAYDVLELAWSHLGVDPSASAPAIVRSLWGIDIDPRATQIAQAAVMFRARRHCRETKLPTANVICARALPSGPEVDDLIESLPEDVARAVRGIADELDDAPVLGPLLKIEERLSLEVRDIFGTGVVEGTLSESASGGAKNIEAAVLDALSTIADSTTSGSAQRLFAAEAQDAVRFVEAMTRRYTAVLMNPPFGEPVRQTKKYLKAVYEWTPSTGDLFAVFVGRGMELIGSNGSLGAITSRVGMYLSSFEEWRKRIILSNQVGPMVDLGENVMEQAMVESAAYILRPNDPEKSDPPVFIRALGKDNRRAVLEESIDDLRQGGHPPSVFRPDLSVLGELEGSPIPYWVDPETVKQLNRFPSFEPTWGTVKVGLQTGDDFQFIRAWWEVDSNRLTRHQEEADNRDELEQLATGARWVPIVKSGSSQPWFSPNMLVVDWEDGGRRLRQFDGSVLRNVESYFKPGFSWTRRAARLVPYVVPHGCIPSVSRYQAFPGGDPYYAIAIAASNIATAYCRFYGEWFSRPNFLVENLKTLPVPQAVEDTRSALSTFVESAVMKRRERFQELEPYREFVAPKPKLADVSWNPGSLLGNDLEERVEAAYGLDAESSRTLYRDLNESLAAAGDSQAVEEGTSENGADGAWTDRLVSYAFGAAIGRWDIRIGMDPDRVPKAAGAFDPLPAVPPGALRQSFQPGLEELGDYPLTLPQDYLLVDQAGHPFDVASKVGEAAQRFLGSESGLAEALSLVMRKPSIREFLRKRFFRSHLNTYSEGRRKAPIYWQLQIPSRNWGVWVYAPKFSREMLYALVRESEQRKRLAEKQIARLSRELDSGDGGRSSSKFAEELEVEQKVVVELETFRTEVERIANLGWEPDLDDGIVLNAAPLAELFPAWNEPSRYRRELQSGKHEWASVAQYADRL